MKQLSLKNGGVAIVDDDDYDSLVKRKWRVNHDGYAMSSAYADLHVNKVYWMHREIIGCRDGYDVDHINGNKLDNRKCNLRECTRSQNNANRGVFSNSATGFKGVAFDRYAYKAYIRINKIRFHLGMFKTPEEAARAYDKAAITAFGKYAKTNFKQGLVN